MSYYRPGYRTSRGRYTVPSYRNFRSDDSMHPASLVFSLLVLVFLFVVPPVIGYASAHANNRTETIYVTSKDDQATGSHGHQYLIFTPQGVFKITDSLWAWKWDSSDVFNGLQEHHWYRCNVHGLRNHFTSNYPNLMSCKSVPAPAALTLSRQPGPSRLR